jgi:hypothetical protein
LSIRLATATVKAVNFLMKGMRRGPRRRLRTERSAKTRLTRRLSSRLVSPFAMATATTGARAASSWAVAEPAMSAIDAKAAMTVPTDDAFRAISRAMLTARVATGAMSLRASSFISGRRDVRRAIAPRRSCENAKEQARDQVSRATGVNSDAHATNLDIVAGEHGLDRRRKGRDR